MLGLPHNWVVFFLPTELKHEEVQELCAVLILASLLLTCAGQHQITHPCIAACSRTQNT
jgi:hypothetical protein